MYEKQSVVVHFAHLRSKLLPGFRLAGYDIPEARSHECVKTRSIYPTLHSSDLST